MDFIDTSTLSLSIGAITCIVVILVTKYALDYRNKDLVDSEKMDYTNIWMYSVVAGVCGGLLVLILYKQFLIYRANTDLMTENFYN